MYRLEGGIIIYRIIQKIRNIIASYSADDRVVIALVISVFISIYATAFMLIFITVYLIRHRRLNIILNSVKGSQYLAAFCILTLIVSLINGNKQGALLAFALAGFFMTALFLRSVMTRRLFDAVLTAGIYASLISFIVIFMQRIAAPDQESYRASSTFMNANFYAAGTEFIILFCVYQLTQAETRRRGIIIAALVWNLGGLYLCDCRTALFALIIAVPILLLLRRRLKALAAVLGTAVLLFLVVWLVPGLFPRLYDTAGDLSLRLMIWKTALIGILRHPLWGQGSGTYLRIYAGYGGPVAMHAHNLLLDPLLNFGIVGTALLVGYLRLNIRSIRRMLLLRQDRPRFQLVVAILVAVIVHGITDTTIFSVQTGLLLAMVLAAAGIMEKKHPARAVARPANRSASSPARRLPFPSN